MAVIPCIVKHLVPVPYQQAVSLGHLGTRNNNSACSALVVILTRVLNLGYRLSHLPPSLPCPRDPSANSSGLLHAQHLHGTLGGSFYFPSIIPLKSFTVRTQQDRTKAFPGIQDAGDSVPTSRGRQRNSPEGTLAYSLALASEVGLTSANCLWVTCFPSELP